MTAIAETLRGRNKLKTRFYNSLHKGDDFCEFLFAFPEDRFESASTLKEFALKGSTLKEKNLLPRRANSFLLE